MQLLHSRIIGEGKPLLILHGYFGMAIIGNRLETNCQILFKFI